jgi:hypothetical protein
MPLISKPKQLIAHAKAQTTREQTPGAEALDMPRPHVLTRQTASTDMSGRNTPARHMTQVQTYTPDTDTSLGV